MFDRSAVMKLRKKEHSYLWAEVSKYATFGNLQRWQVLFHYLSKDKPMLCSSIALIR